MMCFFDRYSTLYTIYLTSLKLPALLGKILQWPKTNLRLATLGGLRPPSVARRT